MTADVGYLNLVAAVEAGKTLMRGFTSVRDMAGPTFGLKRAIDAGIAAGPRIWPSGAMISQTGGHGDFRFPYEIPAAPNAPLTRVDAIGAGTIADGADRVLMRAREQLMLGASQLKLAAGGGVSSNYDPIDVSQYTEAEFRAAVDAAENWGTYVAVHAYTPRAIKAAIRGGVRCIEHGNLMDEATAQLIADNDVWLCAQPFLNNEFANPQPTADGEAKAQQVYAGTDAAYRFARRHKLKTAWGTDILFDPQMTANQGAILTTLARWYSPVEILKMATAVNGELLAMSGPRNPYPGKLGVVEEGALADLILVDGDPLENLKLIADPEKNFVRDHEGWAGGQEYAVGPETSSPGARGGWEAVARQDPGAGANAADRRPVLRVHPCQTTKNWYPGLDEQEYIRQSRRSLRRLHRGAGRYGPLWLSERRRARRATAPGRTGNAPRCASGRADRRRESGAPSPFNFDAFLEGKQKSAPRA